MATDYLPLELKQVTKMYGTIRGISNVSFNLRHGEVFGFLGPNGAGKTTTIRTILNFMRPTHGTIKVFGLDSVKDSIEIKRRVGYLAGDLSIYGHLTGRQFLTFLGSLQGQVNGSYVYDLKKIFQADLSRPLRQLSKGNQQKIGLIQALMHKPALLILDEPTSGLDPLMQERFYDTISEIKTTGTTVLISSHNLNEVQRICDRAAFIRQGEIVSIEDLTQVGNIALTEIRVTFGTAINSSAFKKVPGIEHSLIDGKVATFTVKGSLDNLVKALAKHEVVSLHITETSLEDVFMRQYQEDGKP